MLRQTILAFLILLLSLSGALAALHVRAVVPGSAAEAAGVKAGDTQILVDAGRGVVMRMAGAGSVPAMLAGVLITHLHSDHVCALNDVITTLMLNYIAIGLSAFLLAEFSWLQEVALR